MSEIRLDADAHAAIAEILKVVDAAVKVELAGDKLVKKSKEQADEERRLARVRKQLLDEAMTGSERARKAIEDFNKSIRGQSVDEEKVGRVRAKLAADYVAAINEETGATAELARQREADAEATKQQEAAGKAVAAEERRLASTRERYFEQYQTQSAAITQRLNEFEESIRGQIVNEEQVAAVRAQMHAELQAALDEESGKTALLAKLKKDEADAAKQVADQERKLAGDRKRYFGEYQSSADKVLAKVDEFERSIKGQVVDEKKVAEVRRGLMTEYVAALDEGVEKHDDIDDAKKRAFDPRQVVEWGVRVLGAQAAIQQVIGTLRGMREEVNQLGEDMANLVGSSGNLVQIAGADTALRDKLFAASDEVFATGLVKSREEADKLIFELEQGGRLGELDFFKRVSAIDDAAAIARSVGIVTAGFRGGDAVGSSEQILSKAIAAANPAVGADAKDVAQAVAEVAGIAKQFGLRDEELFGAISVIAEQIGSADTAATNLRQLLISSQRMGLADELRGQGLESIIRRVGREGTTDKDLLKFLGDTQAVLGYAQLKDVGALRQRIREIDAAQRSGLAERTIVNALGSDRIRAGQFRQSTENQGVLDRDREAVDELYADAAQRYMRNRNQAEYGSAVAYAANGAEDMFRTFAGGRQEELATLGRRLSDTAGMEEYYDSRQRIRAGAGYGADEESFYADQRAQQARDSAAFGVQAQAGREAAAAEKQAKKDEAARRREEAAERKVEAESRRQESAAARAEREALHSQREQSEYARVMRETGELARRAGVGFDGAASIDSWRQSHAGESAGLSNTEILREIAKGIRDQGAESKKQTDLLRKRTGTKMR